MQDWISIIILAVIQGIAEWFPISSSGHLVLASKIIGYDNTLIIDVALHLGTLLAVFVYFGKDVMNILRELLSFRFKTEDGRLGIYLIVATIPAAVAGYFLSGFLDSTLNNLIFLVFGLAITSVLLFIASIDFSNKPKREITLRIALLIGLAQVFSLFRGISRSGSTICSGVLLGLNEKKAARFSFLMSMPVIFGASILTVVKSKVTLSSEYFFGVGVSFIVGIATIHFLLKVVLNSKKNLRWFGLYVAIVALSLGVYLLFSN